MELPVQEPEKGSGGSLLSLTLGSFVAGQDAGEEMTWWLVAILIQVYCYECANRLAFYCPILKTKDGA